MTDLMREEFEKSMSSYGDCLERKYVDGYMLPNVQRAWQSWQEGWNAALGLKDSNNLQYNIGDTLYIVNLI